MHHMAARRARRGRGWDGQNRSSPSNGHNCTFAETEDLPACLRQGMVELVQKFEKFESPSSNFWALGFDVPSRLESNFCPVEGVQGVSHSLSKFDRLKIDRDPLDKQRSIELWLLRGLHRLFFAFPPSPSLKKREARVTDGVDIQNQSAHRPNHSHIPPIHPIY